MWLWSLVDCQMRLPFYRLVLLNGQNQMFRRSEQVKVIPRTTVISGSTLGGMTSARENCKNGPVYRVLPGPHEGVWGREDLTNRISIS